MTPLYTWRDVERALRGEEAPPWLEVSADLEALNVTCAPGRRADVARRLADVFGPKIAVDGVTLALESTLKAPRSLRIEIHESDEDATPSPHVVRPLWTDAKEVPGPIHPLPEGSPRLAAFYSYKGGVGRTTTLLATLGALIEPPPRGGHVLVVDADLEAPGLTFEIPGPPDRFCLLDFLALVHDADDWRAVLPLATERLRRNSEGLELSGGRATFYFLPSHRDKEQLFAQPVTIEQVVRGPGRAHVIAEALAALGQALGVDVVLVDLRAGVTELSSPLLLDPRVQTILVTSCSGQSIRGTTFVLERMRSRVRKERRPEVVLSMIPPSFTSEAIARLSGDLQDSIPHAADDIAEEAVQGNVHEAHFAEALIRFDSVEQLLRDLLPGTDLGKRAAPRLAALLAPRATPAATPSPAPTARGLKAVAAEARKLEYAEGNAKLGLLVTPALAALVDQFPMGLPAAVVLGAKGAGKTFAWGQMVLAGDWREFSALVSSSAPALPLPGQHQAFVFPLLSPVNKQPDLAAKVADAERLVWEALGPRPPGTEAPLTEDAMRTDLDRALTRDTDDTEFWTRRVAARLGLPETAGVSVEAVAAALAQRGVAVCLAIDGIEDSFQPGPQSPLSGGQQRLLRDLLQRFTLRVRDLRSPHLGVVTFVRRDLAQAAIVQNFGQFEALHGKFSIVWTSTEALRLVAWILDRAGLHVIDPERIPLAPYDELREGLKAFWGDRLGSERSREAHTDRWVVAALSDFQGRLQARDLVRLVRYAAEKVPDEPKLTPRSLRDALVECSAAKIKELEVEIPGLLPLFERLRKAPEERRKIPFQAEDFELARADVAFLETHGVVIRVEQDELYLPEIVRHGLGFRMDKGRRARVLALYRAAQARRP
ncbi:hypothetical protein WME97_35245 [Sorangium sp. So ce367]|uniref:KGGVGR-motif variant AAA ATPase n=1 Tax=Sorangium sp. So ce367 TaxID=3133305 RepID=UPI003F61BC51